MRLDDNEKNLIVTTVENIFGKAKVYLFGSRLDDTKKGGDIDLFIVADNPSKLFEKKLKALAKLERILHKPVDIVLHQNFHRAIKQEIVKKVYYWKKQYNGKAKEKYGGVWVEFFCFLTHF
jgi:predicted nucleotidyltransferase